MKKLLLIVVCFLVLANLTFAVELWYGFTSEMSKSEAIERAQQLLSPEGIEEREDSRIVSVPSHDDLGYPRPLTRVGFHSQLPEYDSGTNFNLYFYNGKLFCILVTWKAEDVFSVARNRYGNPTKTIRITQWGRPYNAYFWQRPGVDFYVDLKDYAFIDSSARRIWAAEQQRIITESRKAEDAQRRAREVELQREASSTVHF